MHLNRIDIENAEKYLLRYLAPFGGQHVSFARGGVFYECDLSGGAARLDYIVGGLKLWCSYYKPGHGVAMRVRDMGPDDAYSEIVFEGADSVEIADPALRQLVEIGIRALMDETARLTR